MIDRARCLHKLVDGRECQALTRGDACPRHRGPDYVPSTKWPCPGCGAPRDFYTTGPCKSCEAKARDRAKAKAVLQQQLGKVGDDAHRKKVLAEAVRFARGVREKCGL